MEEKVRRDKKREEEEREGGQDIMREKVRERGEDSEKKRGTQ